MKLNHYNAQATKVSRELGISMMFYYLLSTPEDRVRDVPTSIPTRPEKSTLRQDNVSSHELTYMIMNVMLPSFRSRKFGAGSTLENTYLITTAERGT